VGVVKGCGGEFLLVEFGAIFLEKNKCCATGC
jgi:hypothetical protein